MAQLSDGVTMAQESDLSLLESSGFMVMLPEKMYQHRENQICLYGSLIDAHPSNQNTVLTILVYIKKNHEPAQPVSFLSMLTC